MSFDIFDESFYRLSNPDVANAVANGIFPSGLEHFRQFGLAEGRTGVSPLYDEQLYLQVNADVAAVVNSGGFSSGLEHFIRFGEAEGRLSTGLYNEQAYLRAYPDVAGAISAGALSSGLQHFVNFVLPEDSNESRYDALFNEQYYLAANPDVADAVASGSFSSGLQHFLVAGLAEGRVGGTDFNEGFYLRDNTDVADAVARGALASGFDHFARFGRAEGRSGTYFDESLYLQNHSDIAGAVRFGSLDSGYEHYLKFGQFENDRDAVFSGTGGNDIVRSFGGDLSSIIGLDLTSVDFLTGEFTVGSTGSGTRDILIGNSDGEDSFALGNPSQNQKFYLGFSDSDVALIRSFDIGKDSLALSGLPGEYSQQIINGSLNISLASTDDLIAIVEGVGVTLPVDIFATLPGGFYLG